ncbi:General transcription factor 3C polypeptide 2 TF3C-beta Transcription factor IIIC 110 kDa subunit [Channa argus]|uniref:General transcription factor 3C polypeptide 2 TF3C-beta Transcription factor IIIC 110 kDa subunit n=1 Tax=Channa argus TaxID=215402 RepID=A0A6G1QKC1_CHAAH|nr:General transcription factor 3C polypeptide 2 TF3C-beta Transcription factor IIIC 110 kDa subunit [Channa argus]
MLKETSVWFPKGHTVQGKPSEQWNLTPSSKGRQRKQNLKYQDYETDGTLISKSLVTKGGEASPKKTPARSPKVKNATQHIADGEEGASDKTTETPDGKVPEKTPKRTIRASKKTAGKKTPSKKVASNDGPHPTATGVALDTVQQENETVKPKRKYVRKQAVQDATPDTEPPCGKNEAGPPVVPEEEEAEPGGRRRRGAAKMALKYLHVLAKEMLSHNGEESGSQPSANNRVTGTEPVTNSKTPKGNKALKGRKRKRRVCDGDAEDDEDFVPDIKEEAEEEDGEEEFEETEDEEAEDSDLDLKTCKGGPAVFRMYRNSKWAKAKSSNGLISNTMKVVWYATETTKKFREEHYSSWVFPEWVPSTSAWPLVPQSGLEEYLPQQLHSAAFKVSREGLSKEEPPLQRLSRFESVSAHPERWDMLLYAGGPVWAMEWCPTPNGAPATQYVALACHQGMDDIHYVNKMYTGPGLVQLWDVGELEYNKRPDTQPCLAYGLAQDKGFIWVLKWCPAGGWEPTSCERKAPFLPRLGLLAVATSNGVVTIYSLPHPNALNSNNKLPDSGNDSQQLPIYKAIGVVTLKLGAFKAPHHEKSGQVLSMDWLPEKPHNIIAVGFYDGTVGLWDLSTKSSLLRVRDSNEPLSLLPYRCILAHDHAVRALAFCPASRYLLVTAGEDRFVKTWDLKKPYSPIIVQKRNLTNEIYWPLNAPGFLVGQESAYAAKTSQGLHYTDHYLSSLFVIPRTSTVWSISYTDWMNCVVTADNLGEVIFAVLPLINYTCPYMKRTLERRFPVYLTSLVPFDSTGEDSQETGGAEEERDSSDGGNETKIPKTSEEENNTKDESLSLQFETYKEAAKKFTLHHTDYDIRTFVGSEKRAVWKRMKDTEMNRKMTLDEMPLAALHKVRFNPNMNCHIWLVSGGQSGLVRLNCLRSMISPHVSKIISTNQVNFSALYSPRDQTSQTVTDNL